MKWVKVLKYWSLPLNEIPRTFSAKVLVFGEYSVIVNSMALCLPYQQYEGHLAFRRDKEMFIDNELKTFSLYLKKAQEENPSTLKLDLKKFEFDISCGLHFDSSIPQGHGLGSSGALCAAIFDRYKTEYYKTIETTDLIKLKEIFSLMEGHFHGSSSGVDPLVSYLDRPLLINGPGQFDLVNIPDFQDGPGGMFFINTNRARRTEPLVRLFFEKRKDEAFNDICTKVLIPTTNKCVTSFLEGDVESLLECSTKLSQFQYDNFSPMIPGLYKDLWKRGVDTGDYSLKLCGAGGGGLILGLTDNFQKVESILSEYQLGPLFRF
jgi:mevalonate kinase